MGIRPNIIHAIDIISIYLSFKKRVLEYNQVNLRYLKGTFKMNLCVEVEELNWLTTLLQICLEILILKSLLLTLYYFFKESCLVAIKATKVCHLVKFI